MLARNPYLPSTFGNQVGQQSLHGRFRFHELGEHQLRASKFGRQVNLDGPKFDGADVGPPPYVFIVSGIRFFSWTHHGESIACPLSSSNTISSSQERTFDCTATYNVAYTVGGDNYEIIVKDLAISFSGGNSFSD